MAATSAAMTVGRNRHGNAMVDALALLSPTALLGENAATGTDL
jgi:hypothetical protein